MIKFVIESIRNPTWSSEDGSSIDCLLKSNYLVEEVPFTASRHDSEAHGREIYARCLAGEFGEITPLVPRENIDRISHIEMPWQYRLEAFLLEANRENNRKSYRSVAIVWASLLDSLLDQMLEADARCSATIDESIGRPPTKFNERIKRALERGLINQDDAEKCHHIRRVRNQAAHNWELTLESENVLSSLKALHEADHTHVFVFHEDLDFLLKMEYSGSCAMLATKFLTTLDYPIGDGCSSALTRADSAHRKIKLVVNAELNFTAFRFIASPPAYRISA